MSKVDFSDPIFIPSDASILYAMNRMNEIKRKLLLVVDDGRFISVLSIGDIQRAILNQYALSEPILSVLRTNITICRLSDTTEYIKSIMLEQRTEYMPILDDENNLVDLWYWEDVFGEKVKRKNIDLKLPVIIMAGGLGTRLKPLTNVLPKPLLPVNEKTIIEHIMDRFVTVGCKDFYISVNYKSDLIKFHFDNLRDKNYNLVYFKEDKPLGTAGSMYMLKERIKSTFFVTNCDILIDQELEDIYNYHVNSRNLITIVSALKSYKIPYGTLKTGVNGKLLRLDEKPEYIMQINTGMYLLEPEALQYIPENEFFHITELIEKIVENKLSVGVFPIAENSWQDIGDWEEYLKLIRI
jgi:dTDP-glucose pyrophosphorylase